MFCTSCGHNIEEGMAFCTSCGAAAGGRGQAAPGAAPGAPVTSPDVTAPGVPVTPPDVTAVLPIVTPPAPAPVRATAAAAPLTSMPQPSRRRAWLVVPLVVLLLIAITAGGGYAAYKAGLIGSGETQTVVIDDEETTPTASPKDPAAAGASDSEAPASTTLTKQDSFVALQNHYLTLWKLHAGLGLQDKDGYSGTGFVFEAGGFNSTIGAADLAVRNTLVTRCKEWVDKITAGQDELTALKVDPAYEGQKAAIANLYAFMFHRTDAMHQAAVIAVDRPDRDSGWGGALQPRSKDNRVKFENAYPAAKPIAQ